MPAVNCSRAEPGSGLAVADNTGMESTYLLQREQTARRRQRPGETSAALAGRGDSAASIVTGESPERLGLLEQVDRRLLVTALTIRRVEERLLDLFTRGQINGTVHTCIGQEWVGVAVAEHLHPGDTVFSNHRCHGHYIARTNDVEGLIAELMGRSTGVCGGRGGSQHLCRDGFFSNGVQGGIVPVAAGLAMGQDRGHGHARASGRPSGDGIAVVFIGDGTLGEGLVYETLNIASKWSLPLLIVLEDNGIAQSTDQLETLAGTIAGRANAFNVPCIEATTDEPTELIDLAGQAVQCVRQDRSPLLLHVRTRRLRSHSKGDDTRDAQQLAALAEADTLNALLATGTPQIAALLESIDERIDAAVQRALAAPTATIEINDENAAEPPDVRWHELSFASKRVNDAIRDALADGMHRDESILLLGEDVRDPYGGAFRVTAGLSTRFGDRVCNTPISEAAIVGIANGLALAGGKPVVEIMFGDFLLLAADQIVNHAAKFAWMYNEQVNVPMLVRTPMGGYRGYGPTHSQSLEKHLLGVPGLRVLALTHRYCPDRMYRTILETIDRPTLAIENKLLYGTRSNSEPPAGCRLEATDALFPTLRIAPEGDCQLTIVAYGGTVNMVEAAMGRLAAEEELACELLIPTQLYPLDVAPIADSLRRTGRLLVVEEGQGFAGFGGELIARMACAGGGLQTAFARISAEPCPIPAAKSAEIMVLPSIERVVEAARDLVVHS